ncbi:peptide-methionine (S)-S-oxide reductase MsrA [Croceibacterium sp. TMG7-5b_MA50]|uniref:peptide-methionine (S)-S-oxide reductase MsrA n=1 Tax=Croceibacterium sp. TMG7-5b_MA50 TaxID=3121290 RepID=UPI0032218995
MTLRPPLLLVAAALAACAPAAAADNVVEAPAATRTAQESGGLKAAYFAGGCFWGVEAVFSHVRGVTSAVSGYHGGNRATANYDRVSSGVTGHAETVRVIYDPAQVRYDELLRIFFSVVADPTLRDRQGPDRGSQYRAALIPVDAEQRAVAAAYLSQMRASGVWQRPIVTEIERPREFFVAEDEHQDFARRNPRHGYIQRWDAPKVTALARLFPGHYRATFRNG